jgi:opacity protein-like surface antigen
MNAHYPFSMKKIIIATAVCFTLLSSSVSQAALDPKLKMVAAMAGYGVVGGAMLGTASMAFGAGGRSIAKGASIGLYAGLLFGGYIILNYEMKKRGYGQEVKGDYYPESSSPYENDQTNLSVDLGDYRLAQFENKKDPKMDPLFYMNFFNLEF